MLVLFYYCLQLILNQRKAVVLVETSEIYNSHSLSWFSNKKQWAYDSCHSAMWCYFMGGCDWLRVVWNFPRDYHPPPPPCMLLVPPFSLPLPTPPPPTLPTFFSSSSPWSSILLLYSYPSLSPSLLLLHLRVLAKPDTHPFCLCMLSIASTTFSSSSLLLGAYHPS